MILLAVYFLLYYFKLSTKGKIIKIHNMIMLSFNFKWQTIHIDASDLAEHVNLSRINYKWKDIDFYRILQ